MTADVTFIIPAHNSSATVGETLVSLVEQVHSSWTALVIDDGSSDATAELVQDWTRRDARIHLAAQDHRGVSAARNHGLQLADSYWVVFLDSDDLVHPQYLSAMLARATAAHDVGLVHCGLRRLATDGRLGSVECAPRERYFEALAKYNCFGAPHVCLVRRQHVIDAGGFDESLDCGEEWDLWQRIARLGLRFSCLDEALSLYRMRPGSLVRRPGRLMACGRAVIVRGHGPDLRVSNPAPEFAAGVTDGRCDAAVGALLLWAAGIALGAGEDVSQLAPWMDEVVALGVIDLDVAGAAEVFVHGALVGNCSLPDRWQSLWRERAAGTEAMMSWLRRHPGGDAWTATFMAKVSARHRDTWRERPVS